MASLADTRVACTFVGIRHQRRCDRRSTRRAQRQIRQRVCLRLTESIFGHFGQAGGGLLGGSIGQSGIFGTLTGAPTAIQTPAVTITAATVTMGGVGSLGLGAAPGAGTALTGAGSGMTGFGLGGAQSAGAQAIGSGLGTFGFGPNGTSLGGMSMGTSAALDMIMKHESGGRNILQQAVGPNGGFNPSTGTITGPSSASGYFQMINGTWRSAAKMAGIDASQFPTAMSAPYELQRKAAGALFEKEGFAPWAPYNASLDKRADLAVPDAEQASKTLASASDQASDSMSSLSDAAAQIPTGTDAATSGLSQLASSLMNFRPGGGGMNLAGLFGGGPGSGGSGMFVDGVTSYSANGNIMTSRGPLPLSYYSRGGVATDPQISVFGEGRLSEAYVPLPDGRSIPVTMKDARAQRSASGSGGSVPSFAVNITNQGGGRVETSEPKSDGRGGYSIDVMVREVERTQADRMGRGRGALGPAVDARSRGNAASRVG